MSRKGNSSSGSFGNPKPLPGQAGYKTTETDQLRKDTQGMEANLLMLQEKMRQQELESMEATAKAGGKSTWSSARKDKGSIGGYGKEVQDKFKKKLDSTIPRQSLLRGTASARRLLASEENADNITSKGVNDWSVGDVSAWLTDLQLKDYVSAFAQNAINGSVLLDITNDDLDYMEIKALGHRKIIMRGVEDLRQTGRYTRSPANIAPPILRTSSNPNIADDRTLMSQSMTLDGAKSVPQRSEEKEIKTKHWSQLEPISSNQVSHPRGGASVNAADEGDVLDEAAERQAFMDAVAEWRKADAVDGPKQPLRIEREYLGKGGSSAKSSTGAGSKSGAEGGSGSLVGGDAGAGMWKNPFAPPSAENEVFDDSPPNSDVLDEAAERRAFQAAVMEWRRGPVSPVPTEKTSDRGKAAAGTSALGSGVSPTKVLSGGTSMSAGVSAGVSAGGGSMLNGNLDEEHEHKEFVKAVESWRNRDADGNPMSTANTQTLAEKLAQEMEAERVASSLRIQKQREDAERRLREANLELAKMRSTRAESKYEEEEDNIREVDETFDPDNDNNAEDLDDKNYENHENYKNTSNLAAVSSVYTYSSAPASHAAPSSARSRAELLEISPRVTPSSNPASPNALRSARERDWKEEEDYELAGKGNNVTLSLVESTIGEAKHTDEGEYYVVEVDSDDDN